MAGYQRANAEAAAELIRQLSPVLFRFFASDLATRAFAEDLLQECWLRIHKSRHTYLPGEPLLPWVFAIARHTRVDVFQRRRRIESHELALEDCDHRAAPAAPPDAESGDLSRLLEHLPESQREVILMLKVAGMTLEEVAGSTSSTVGSVKQKAHRAYRKLRQILQRSASERVRP
jgi:RNA polymerase sigma-70 factor (ECF subfamily)